jgi:3',5'-cyclic AMP phosphodiesterase CpdA
MFTLAHISDIHLSPLPRPRVFELLSKRALGYANWTRRRFRHRRDVLDRLMDDLRTHSPDHIAMTGDLVNIALPEEFRAARVWLEGIGGPDGITVIPGNHDAYVPFLRNPWVANWQPYMVGNADAQAIANGYGHSFPFLRRFGEVVLIGLSSARATMPAMASGRLGKKQIAQAAALLDALGKQGFCRVVLIHHPPLPGMADWQRGLHDAGRFRDVLTECGAELVLHGHNHRVMSARLDSRTGPVPIIGAPSASVASDDPETGAGFNLFTIAKGGNGAWRIGMRSRSFDLQGRVNERHVDLLS